MGWVWINRDRKTVLNRDIWDRSMQTILCFRDPFYLWPLALVYNLCVPVYIGDYLFSWWGVVIMEVYDPFFSISCLRRSEERAFGSELSGRLKGQESLVWVKVLMCCIVKWGNKVYFIVGLNVKMQYWSLERSIRVDSYFLIVHVQWNLSIKTTQRRQETVVFIGRWSLCTGSFGTLHVWMRNHFKGNNKCGLCKQVVFLYRWSLKQVWLFKDLCTCTCRQGLIPISIHVHVCTNEDVAPVHTMYM